MHDEKGNATFAILGSHNRVDESPKAFILISPAVRISNPTTTVTTKHNNNNNNHHLYHHVLRQVGLSATLCLVGRYTSSKVQWDVLLKHAGMEIKDQIFVSIGTIN
jgi:hypothetical protein